MGRTRKEVFIVIIVDECIGDLALVEVYSFRLGKASCQTTRVFLEHRDRCGLVCSLGSNSVCRVKNLCVFRLMESGYAQGTG